VERALKNWLIFFGAAALAICQSCQSQHPATIPPDQQLAVDSTGIVYDSIFSGSVNLQKAIDAAKDGDTLILPAGIYYADPKPFTDPLCGNCLDQKTAVAASTGFVIRDKSIVIIGRGSDSTALVTGAGYGVYFENSSESRLIGLRVMGGRRDLDGNATDAAVVVRESRVYIEYCSLSGNNHRQDSVVVGIGGVFGREGAEIFVSYSDIIDNGWDGMALYRGAAAVISDCVIKKGRGAGIGVTWDAHCVTEGNRISEYWKGIGSFGTSTVIAHNNLVYDNLGWGIIGTGESYLDAANNVVYHNGNCGLAPWSQESRGRFVNNIVTDNGWRKEWVCPCVGVWNYGDLNKWQFYNNLIWNNAAGNFRDMPDITGRDGNISVDPMFVGEGDFHLRPGSPAIDAGYKEINDHDGSPSDLGIYGGTSAHGNKRLRQWRIVRYLY
jgi:hypothetical protein